MAARLRLGQVQLHLLITSPADEPDFDNTGGTTPLNRSPDMDSSAFPKSSASSTVQSNPTPVLEEPQVRGTSSPTPSLTQLRDRLHVPNACFNPSLFVRPARSSMRRLRSLMKAVWVQSARWRRMPSNEDANLDKVVDELTGKYPIVGL
jgi:hypothetical protein